MSLKNGLYVIVQYRVGICTELRADILKMLEFFFNFEHWKRIFSHYSLGFQYFTDFQITSDFGYLKAVLGPLFAFLTKNWLKNMYHTTKT